VQRFVDLSTAEKVAVDLTKFAVVGVSATGAVAQVIHGAMIPRVPAARQCTRPSVPGPASVPAVLDGRGRVRSERNSVIFIVGEERPSTARSRRAGSSNDFAMGVSAASACGKTLVV
jgi:hypothetical protein